MQTKDWSDCMDEQTDLSLHWTHMSEITLFYLLGGGVGGGGGGGERGDRVVRRCLVSYVTKASNW